jgi:hypothetical protein
VKQLLVAYRAETSKLDVHYIDPDRDAVALEDVRKRFKIETGRTEAGHIVADAVVVVSHGVRHWFVTSSELVDVGTQETGLVRPREERALTGAIRNVLSGAKTRVCFTTGHGELSPSDEGERGVGALRDVLSKDNYDVGVVDAPSLAAPKPFDGCAVVVIAGLRVALSDEETERLRTWLLDDGNLLLGVGPLIGGGPSAASPSGGGAELKAPGLERILAPFGVVLDDVVVTEQGAELALPNSGGFRFFAEPRRHPITAALVKSDASSDVPRVALHIARSLHRGAEVGAPMPFELLATSAQAFGLRSIDGAADWTDAPVKKAGDLAGPLALAMASERPKVSASSRHGARLVVVGTASVLGNDGFREAPMFRGGALFSESAISWLAAQPQVLDVPERAPVGAGMRITEESRGSIRRYVVFFMPATVLILGIAIAIFRRAGEGKPDARSSSSKKLSNASNHAGKQRVKRSGAERANDGRGQRVTRDEHAKGKEIETDEADQKRSGRGE